MNIKSFIKTFAFGILSFSIFPLISDANAQTTSGIQQVKQTLSPNHPIGTPKGIFPGRVVWSHAPGTAKWDKSDDKWYVDTYNNQKNCNWLIDTTICNLAGTENAKQGWKKIFRHFNSEHGKGNSGYKKGEIVTIKINNNNTASHTDSEEINASPQMVYALLKSLIENGGVSEECIIVAEPSRFITDYLYNKCHNSFPQVKFVDNSGEDGREKADYINDAMHYSKDNGELATGIATAFTEASYVINMALLKGHVGQGVTLCGKNWYGAMSIHADWRKNFHNNFNQSRDGQSKYITFVDFMGHKDLGGKCMLWFIDALYGCRNVGGTPGPRWKMVPFSGDWPNSLFGSLDPVAIDMVGVDFLTNEFPDMPDVNYSDMYLVEAATADNPSSATFYDPNGKGIRLKSLGVAEHWDNKVEKKYSGNKDSKSIGIELLYFCKEK